MKDIYSMTGFGRSEAVDESYRLLCEVKSVNHRYLDVTVKMPRIFNCFEARIRKLVSSHISRGKTEIYLYYESYASGGKRLKYNEELATEYVGYLAKMSADLGLKNDIGAPMLARCPEVFTMEEKPEDEDLLWERIEPVLVSALTELKTARAEEGERLREDLFRKLCSMSEFLKGITELSPSVTELYKERLLQRIKETLGGLDLTADEGRILTEVAIFSDKVCTDEETVRLESHIGSMRDKLKAGSPCGRDLDFMAQEMNREANTILSKANDIRVSDTAIAIKAEIEKIREQVQNIE